MMVDVLGDRVAPKMKLFWEWLCRVCARLCWSKG